MRTVGAGRRVARPRTPARSTLLMGPSGSGKSTLLAVLSGLLQPDAGQVLALGQDLWAMTDAAARAVPAAALRLHLPGLQPVPGPDRPAAAGDGAALGRGRVGRARRGGGPTRCWRCSAWRKQGAPAAGRAVRRREAARGHRPGADQGAAASASPTSRPAPWTGRTASRWSSCCGTPPTTAARRSWWSPTTPASSRYADHVFYLEDGRLQDNEEVTAATPGNRRRARHEQPAAPLNRSTPRRYSMTRHPLPTTAAPAGSPAWACCRSSARLLVAMMARRPGRRPAPTPRREPKAAGEPAPWRWRTWTSRAACATCTRRGPGRVVEVPSRRATRSRRATCCCTSTTRWRRTELEEAQAGAGGGGEAAEGGARRSWTAPGRAGACRTAVNAQKAEQAEARGAGGQGADVPAGEARRLGGGREGDRRQGGEGRRPACGPRQEELEALATIDPQAPSSRPRTDVKAKKTQVEKAETAWSECAVQGPGERDGAAARW